MKAAIYKLFFIALILSVSVRIDAQMIIRTVAGIYDSTGSTGDGGPAIAAEIGEPNGVATDAAGNLYIADHFNNVVRKVTVSGIISTVAGVAGTSGYNGDNIPAVTARLNQPIGIAVDNIGNLYIADNANFRIRKVDTAGIITTVAGMGGIFGFGNSGDGGPATSAHIYVVGVAVDQFQNIYFADGNTAIRKVNHATGIISTVAGSGAFGFSGNGGPATSAALATPTGVAVDDAGNIYIADYGNNVVRYVDNAATPIIHPLAGTGTAGYAGDAGPAVSARLNQPYGVGIDRASGILYIADMNNNRIRALNTTSTAPVITTVAGTGVAGYAGDGGLATLAKINGPSAVCVNGEGSFFIADNSIYGPGANDVVREVSNPATIIVTPHPGSDICIGTPVLFTATVHNLVLGQAYQWHFNGANVGTDSLAYYNTTLNTGDQIYCTTSFPNATTILANSDTVTMNVHPLLVPSINIGSDTNNICAGLPVVFSATSVNGGATPLYQWQVNGAVAHTGATYTYDPVNGDVVNCFLTSNAICATPDTVTSSVIKMQINADVIMHVNIMAISGDSILNGAMTSFIAEPTNEGSAPAYQWFVNSIAIPGATNHIYNTDTLHENDAVTCVLTGSLPCTLPLTDTSISTIVHITNLAVGQSSANSNSIALLPNPNHGKFYVRGSLNITPGMEADIEVTDMLGQIVYKGKLAAPNGTVDTAIELNNSLSDGMYQLRVISGGETSVVSFVIGK